MRWSYNKKHCLNVSPSEADVLGDILTSTYDALQAGYIQMSPSELNDFNSLCEQADLSLSPLSPENLPVLRRIK